MTLPSGLVATPNALQVARFGGAKDGVNARRPGDSKLEMRQSAGVAETRLDHQRVSEHGDALIPQSRDAWASFVAASGSDSTKVVSGLPSRTSVVNFVISGGNVRLVS